MSTQKTKGSYTIVHEIKDHVFIFTFVAATAARLRVHFWLMAQDYDLPYFTIRDAKLLSDMVHELELAIQ